MRIERYINIGFIVVVLLYVAGTFLTYSTNKEIIEAGKELSKSNRVLYQLESLKREIITIQSYSRAYIITSDTEFFKVTSRTIDSAYQRGNVLRNLLVGEQQQLVLLDSTIKLGQMAAKRNVYMNSLVKEGKKDKAVQFVESGEVVALITKIEAMIDKMKEDEQSSMAVSEQVLKGQQKTIVFTYGLRAVLVPLILLAVFILMRKGFRALYKTQARLTQTATLLSGLIENAPVAISVRDAEGNIIIIYDALLKSFGLTTEQVKGKNISDFLPAAETERIKLKDLEVLKSNIKREAENTLTVNGLTQTIFSVSFPVRDEEGIVNYVCNIGINITDRKSKEEIIRKMNEELQQKMKAVTDYQYALDESAIIAVTDQAGKIIHVNNNFCRISKYTTQELIGQDHRIVNSGYHSKDFIKNLWTTIASGKVWRGEMKNKAKDGTYYWVDTTIVPFLNLVGKPFQYVAIRSDITKRKLHEESILALNQQLETTISDLKEANKEMEIFTYSVAHDMRTPLRAISAFATLLQSEHATGLNEEGKRFLGILDDNAQNMGKLIDSLLKYATIGQTTLSLAQTNITALASKVIDELRVTDPTIKANITIGNAKTIQCDPALMKLLLQNLFSNAFKYTSRTNAPKILFDSYQDNDEMIFFVKDNGAGFDMQYIDKLFLPFQRLHAEEDFEGTGIGLAIVQRIIQKHGGTVWADAKVNQGATFYFSLPYIKNDSYVEN